MHRLFSIHHHHHHPLFGGSARSLRAGRSDLVVRLRVNAEPRHTPWKKACWNRPRLQKLQCDKLTQRLRVTEWARCNKIYVGRVRAPVTMAAFKGGTRSPLCDVYFCFKQQTDSLQRPDFKLQPIFHLCKKSSLSLALVIQHWMKETQRQFPSKWTSPRRTSHFCVFIIFHETRCRTARLLQPITAASCSDVVNLSGSLPGSSTSGVWGVRVTNGVTRPRDSLSLSPADIHIHVTMPAWPETGFSCFADRQGFGLPGSFWKDQTAFFTQEDLSEFHPLSAANQNACTRPRCGVNTSNTAEEVHQRGHLFSWIWKNKA